MIILKDILIARKKSKTIGGTGTNNTANISIKLIGSNISVCFVTFLSIVDNFVFASAI